MLTQTESGALNEFSSKINDYFLTSNLNKNFFYSGLSLQQAMSMAYVGSKGLTSDDLGKFLNFQSSDDSLYLASRVSDWLAGQNGLKISNSFWSGLGYDLNEVYYNKLKKYFSAMCKSLDFSSPSAIKEINAWIEDKTEGLIPELFSSLNPKVVSVLINTLYFKGLWRQPFNPTKTIPNTPFKFGATEVGCNMMHQRKKFFYYSCPSFKAVSLDYMSNNFSMVIFLPKDEKALRSLAPKLLSGLYSIENIQGSFKLTDLDLAIPKFTLSCHSNFGSILKEDLPIPFKASGDYSPMFKNQTGAFFIEDLIQKAILKVDELGTEAAAATAMTLSRGVDIIHAESFVCDRPFLFLIVDKTYGTVLFTGQVVDPTQANTIWG